MVQNTMSIMNKNYNKRISNMIINTLSINKIVQLFHFGQNHIDFDLGFVDFWIPMQIKQNHNRHFSQAIPSSSKEAGFSGKT